MYYFISYVRKTKGEWVFGNKFLYGVHPIVWLANRQKDHRLIFFTEIKQHMFDDYGDLFV